MALSCSPTRSTNSWRSSPKAHSKRAHSKKDSEREPTEDFPPRASGCASKVRDHRLADRRKDETVVAERSFPVDGERRSPVGSAGSTSRKSRLRTAINWQKLPKMRAAADSAMFFCWAWAVRAFARK